jgi:uncharacterized protein YndB with AHSA1/START domain
MKLFQPLILKHSIEINTTPEKIWEFFVNLEENYTTWHPEDHIVFRWISGEPLEVGSRFYSEQLVHKKPHIYKGEVGEIIPNRKIVFRFSFPISLVSPTVEWLIEPKDSLTVFTAISYFRLGILFQKLFKKDMEELIKAHDRHVGTEGENLKRILEG